MGTGSKGQRPKSRPREVKNVVGFREVVMVLPVYAGHCDQIAVTRTDRQLFG